ncbi:nucleoside hydrolase [Kribbella sp. NPDC051770]|uniref:nucleoside hydrolase n=1 Tax=Kribbella sp. NPDC051770 TaxID=3155413 RepID=UPI0034362623
MAGPRRQVVVDTDTGLDDAHSLLYLLAQPDLELLGVTAIFGNTTVDQATRNIAAVLEVADRADVPIFRGAAVPLAGELRIDPCWHGVDGLGDRGLSGAVPVPRSESAADFLVRIANERPGQVDLHPIGPLTNVALALRRDPDLLTKFRSVVLMGGGGPYPPPGGLTLTDANSDHDRAAAEIVYTARNTGNVVMVGVNVTLQALLYEHDYDRLRSAEGRWPQFAATILDASNATYEHVWGRRISAAHDALASVVLHRPEIATGWVEGPVTFTPAAGSFAVQVARTHDGRPLSFKTPDGPVVRAVTSFDHGEFVRVLMDALLHGAPGQHRGAVPGDLPGANAGRSGNRGGRDT